MLRALCIEEYAVDSSLLEEPSPLLPTAASTFITTSLLSNTHSNPDTMMFTNSNITTTTTGVVVGDDVGHISHISNDVPMSVDETLKEEVEGSDTIMSSNNEQEEEVEEGSEATTALITRKHAIEIVRYGGNELHNISALIGGIAAQEAVKIITHQFVPLNNTYIFNGIVSCGATYIL